MKRHRKTASVTYPVLIFLITIISSCTTTIDRSPNAAKARNEMLFNLHNNPDLLNHEYSFELLSLNELSQSKISFKKLSIKSSEAPKAMSEWVNSLSAFSAAATADLSFTVDKLPISMKPSDFKRLHRALEIIAAGNESANAVLRKQVAVVSAFNQKFKEPLDLNLEVLTLPFEFLKRVNPYPINEQSGQENLKIQNSSFWTDRSSEQINMSLGASELNLALVEAALCEYAGPKKGFGIHQGLKVKCEGREFKIKFGEIRSAPLNSKIYHRLGYNVPAIHSVKHMNVKYDRKMLTELNSGKQQYVRIQLLGKPVKSIPVRKHTDFDTHISHAVLKSGESVSTADLLKKLLPTCGPADQNCHLNAQLYDAQFENELSHIVFHEIAIVEENNDHEFGAWAFDELDHKNRTEVRALVLVGAFTGNHDLRKDNNKLLWSSKTSEIKHAITDPGSGYGSARPFVGFNINDMKWKLMREKVTPANESGPGTTTIVIDEYKPNVNHSVFSKLNMGEAKWMGRQIAGISEDELSEAMAASGFSMAELILAREKLVSLQKNIVEVLELTAEFPELARRSINQKINFDSRREKQLLTLRNGKQLSVEEKNDSLVNGVLVKH